MHEAGWQRAFTNDPAAGSNIELEMPDTSGFTVNDIVVVQSSAGTELATITVVHANVHITVATLALNHTTSGRLVWGTQLTFDIPAGVTTSQVIVMSAATSGTEYARYDAANEAMAGQGTICIPIITVSI
jgi:hypothetical protein